jgi:hypothetical protein
VEEADRQDAWERYEENVFVFSIGGDHGHIVTVEEIERITQKNRRLANEFWWMWGIRGVGRRMVRWGRGI